MDTQIQVIPPDKSGFILTEDNLYSHELTIGADLGSFSFGLFSASELRLEIIDEGNEYAREDFANSKYKAYYGGQEIGEYDTDSVTKQDGMWEVVAYDGIKKFDTPFTTSLFPLSFRQALSHAMFLSGLWGNDMDENSLSEQTVSNVPEIPILEAFSTTMVNFTCRDVVAAIAELCGCQATLDRDGKLLLNNPFSGSNTWNYSDDNADTLQWDKEIKPITKIKTTQTPSDSGLLKTLEFGTDEGFTVTLTNQVFAKSITESNLMSLLESLHGKINNSIISSISATELIDANSVPYHRVGDILFDRKRDLTGIITKISYSDNFVLSYACPPIVEETRSASGLQSGSIISQASNNAAALLSLFQIKRATNTREIKVSGASRTVVDLTFLALSTTTVAYSTTVKFVVESAGTLEFAINVGGWDVILHPEYFNIGPHSRTFTYAPETVAGISKIRINAKTFDGAVAIFPKLESWATVTGVNFGGDIPWDGTIFIAEEIPKISITPSPINLLGITYHLSVSRQVPVSKSITQAIPLLAVATTPITLSLWAERLNPCVLHVRNPANTVIVMTFGNPIYTNPLGIIDPSEFTVTGIYGATPMPIAVHAAALETLGGANLLDTVQWYDGGVDVDGATIPSGKHIRTDLIPIDDVDHYFMSISTYANKFRDQTALERYSENQLEFYREIQLEGRAYKASVYYYDDNGYIGAMHNFDSALIVPPTGTTGVIITMREITDRDVTLDDLYCFTAKLEVGSVSTLFAWSNKIMLSVDSMSAYNKDITATWTPTNAHNVSDDSVVKPIETTFERQVYG